MNDKLMEHANAELAGWTNPQLRLSDALHKDEFALYCQPILALSGPERYPMAEVLVRLREEEKALLPPGEFLPVFEHYRMMPQLDRWVVSRVLRRIKAGSKVPCFCANLSGQTLEDLDFPKFFADEVKATGVPASSVCFELDETDVLAKPQAVARFTAAAKATGAGIVIDGFGRKAVSFTPLKALAVDYVKVDGSIVRKLLQSEVARTKMNAVLRVGQAVGFRVIAECVEEQDILMRLKALGVGFAQGFGIHHPQPIDAIAEASPAKR
jgi:EAL domain-containing protein (putative c-di-GMP-specific phosphodiesterase class I)